MILLNMSSCKTCKHLSKSSLSDHFDRCNKFNTYAFLSVSNSSMCSKNRSYYEVLATRLKFHCPAPTTKPIYRFIVLFVIIKVLNLSIRSWVRYFRRDFLNSCIARLSCKRTQTH